MARTISAELLAEQSGGRKPYIKVSINNPDNVLTDYSSSVEFIEHHEEPYRDWATIILNNADRGLDSVSMVGNNLLGRRFRIGYGHYTGVNVVEPNGDNAGNEYSYSADLWVKSQQMVSLPGRLECHLYCEGQWAYLREQRLMATGSTPANFEVGDPADVGSDPYYSNTFNATKTVYQLIESILEYAFPWTLNASPSVDDGILNTFKPVFSFEELPYAADVLKRLIAMTKCYLRAKADLAWDVVYPQDADGVNESFYSDKAPYFSEYVEKINLVVPNRIVVFGGNPENKAIWPIPVVVGDSGAYSGNYVEVIDFLLEPSITTEQDADNRSSAFLTKYKAEQLAGYLLVPHDARMELYDKVSIEDNRS